MIIIITPAQQVMPRIKSHPLGNVSFLQGGINIFCVILLSVEEKGKGYSFLLSWMAFLGKEQTDRQTHVCTHTHTHSVT